MPEIDSTTLASLNAMDAEGLRSFAKEHEIRVTPLPNVRVDTLRAQIVTELETRLAAAAPASTETAPAATETAEPATETAEPAPEPAAAPEPAPEVEQPETVAAEPEAAAEPAPEAVVATDAEFVPYEGETVRMFHPNPAEGMPEFADVHPDEVDNWNGEGWLVADESDADNG